VLVEATGPADPDHVWTRYTTPDAWPSWAPHMRDVVTDADRLARGATGRVLGPRGVSVDFTIDDVDPDLRAWAWTVRRGPLAVHMEHHVLPVPGGGSRATMRVVGAPAVPLQPYRLLAVPALRRLVHDVRPGGGPAEADAVSAFAFAFTPSYALAARPFGITPATTAVEVGPRWLHVRYGAWRLLTPRSNVASATLTGGFSLPKTAGPPHLSLADRGVSFTTNGDRALCLTFHEPVTVLDPTGTLRHPGATLAVADPEGLAAALGLDVA
jgi:Polyketide cyclase / dehydrase and lipid transport